MVQSGLRDLLIRSYTLIEGREHQEFTADKIDTMKNLPDFLGNRGDFML